MCVCVCVLCLAIQYQSTHTVCCCYQCQTFKKKGDGNNQNLCLTLTCCCLIFVVLACCIGNGVCCVRSQRRRRETVTFGVTVRVPYLVGRITLAYCSLGYSLVIRLSGDNRKEPNGEMALGAGNVRSPDRVWRMVMMSLKGTVCMTC